MELQDLHARFSLQQCAAAQIVDLWHKFDAISRNTTDHIGQGNVSGDCFVVPVIKFGIEREVHGVGGKVDLVPVQDPVSFPTEFLHETFERYEPQHDKTNKMTRDQHLCCSLPG